MILKINSDFTNLDYILNSLKSFNIIFYNNTLYVSCCKDISDEKFIKEVKEVLENNTCIIQLNENNLLNETFYIQQWCKEQFVQQDKNRYEKEKQEKLQNIMFFLDKLEENIFKQEGV